MSAPRQKQAAGRFCFTFSSFGPSFLANGPADTFRLDGGAKYDIKNQEIFSLPRGCRCRLVFFKALRSVAEVMTERGIIDGGI